jgi:hypothetical protein
VFGLDVEDEAAHLASQSIDAVVALFGMRGMPGADHGCERSQFWHPTGGDRRPWLHSGDVICQSRTLAGQESTTQSAFRRDHRHHAIQWLTENASRYTATGLGTVRPGVSASC